MLVVADSIWVPMRLGFSIEGGMELFIYDRITDFFFVVDLIMNFLTAIDDRKTEQQLIDGRTIAKKYCRTWFLVDFVSVLPFDLLPILFFDEESNSRALASTGLLKMLKIFRLLKMLRLMRIYRMFQRFEKRLRVTYAVVDAFKFTCFVTIGAHWMTCFWYGIGNSQENESRWINHYNVETEELYWKSVLVLLAEAVVCVILNLCGFL